MTKRQQTLRVNKWVKALRSGKYAQTPDNLRHNDAFCCLGVACEVFNPNGWDTYDNYDGEPQYLPGEVRDYFGMNSSPGYFNYNTLPDEVKERVRALDVVSEKDEYFCGSLTYLNDNGVPFDVIADVIEARPDGLFEEI